MSKKNETRCDYGNERGSNNTIENAIETTSKIVKIMKPVPFWSGVGISKDSQIVKISRDDYRGKYLVLIFYPYDFTIVCPTELLQFSDRVDEFEDLGCKIVAVSTDSEFAHLAWSTTPRKQGGLGEMRLPMLSDKNHEISKMYGVYDCTLGIAYRGLFIIDNRFILRHVTINDTAIPRCVDEVLRVIEASQFVDKHGDICPLGPVQDKPETNVFDEKPKRYFSTDLIKASPC